MSLMSSHLHRQLPFWLFLGFQKTAVSDKSPEVAEASGLNVLTVSPLEIHFSQTRIRHLRWLISYQKSTDWQGGSMKLLTPGSSLPSWNPQYVSKICVFVIIWVIAVITGSYGVYDVSCPCLCYFDCFKMQVRVSRRPKLANCVGGSWGSATHNGLHECIRLHALRFCARWYVS